MMVQKKSKKSTMIKRTYFQLLCFQKRTFLRRWSLYLIIRYLFLMAVLLMYWKIKPIHCVKSDRIRNYSDLYFTAFGLHIQSECGKIRTRITPNMVTFYAVIYTPKNSLTFSMNIWLTASFQAHWNQQTLIWLAQEEYHPVSMLTTSILWTNFWQLKPL